MTNPDPDIHTITTPYLTLILMIHPSEYMYMTNPNAISDIHASTTLYLAPAAYLRGLYLNTGHSPPLLHPRAPSFESLHHSNI